MHFMMANITFWILPVVFLLAVAGIQLALGQDYDFSDPIKCFVCEGDASNGSCADPFVETSKSDEFSKTCEQGMCVKWTKYKDGVLQMIRACTADLNFHLTMIDGVCRTERSGNGYLCMCGKSMCNSASKTFIPRIGETVSQYLAFWATVGVLVLFPKWLFNSFWHISPC